MEFSTEQNSLAAALKFDQQDSLRSFREQFAFPKTKSGEEYLYFAGHSLGLKPHNADAYLNEELKSWGTYGVEGHFEGKHPWLPYHENVTGMFARLVGARESEVVAMNSLTVNLHLMLVSFYRPNQKRFKILIENNTFPSDKYAVDSQARFHGLDPATAVVELKPTEGNMTISTEDIIQQINALGDSLAVVMLGNCNYLSGQCFDFEKITQAAHKVGAFAGFNLAHGAGNLYMHLHDWNVDFAMWCSYKYLNAGPGGIAGAFVHENHLGKKDLPRFEGWWGTNKTTRFKMGPQFDPIPTIEAWQLSNPPIFQLASLRASLELFDKATMKSLRQKSDHLTSYLEFLLKQNLEGKIEIVTPAYSSSVMQRGSMLCLKLKGQDGKKLSQELRARGCMVDFREPNIIRMTPAPLYNSYADVFRVAQAMKEVFQ